MLKRLPIGIQTFSEIREQGYLYVDKTALVYRMTHEYKYVFLSRPRRFGKSLLCSTLKSYFEGRKDLFEGLKMIDLEQEWSQHPVLLISLASVKGGTVEDFNSKIDIQLSMYEERYGLARPGDDPGARFENLIKRASGITGKNAVVIIDEYDVPLLSVLHDEEKLKEMRTCVRSFFGCLKDCDPYLRFVFLTGVSKFSQVSIFSELNNLVKISMMPRFSTLCGITQEELQTQMLPWVERMAEELSLTTGEVLAALKKKYDGYHFARDLKDLYNPYSLLNAFDQCELKDYWFDTGTPSFLISMLRKFDTDIRELEGCIAKANDFDAPAENMKSVMPLFYQSGYLTIKGYNQAGDIYTLDIPNHEVRMGLYHSLAPYYISDNVLRTNSAIMKATMGILEGDMEGALQIYQAFLSSIPYAENASSEGHFQTLLYVLFSLLGEAPDLHTEVRTATGRIDMLVGTKNDLYVMELKIDQSAQKALEQIDQKDYLLSFKNDPRHLYKVGINFSTKQRTLNEWKIMSA